MPPVAPLEEASGQTTDADLLTRWTDLGDHRAFDELYRRHATLVLGACRRRGSPDPEDAVQLVFLTLFRRPESVGDRTRLAGWLLGVSKKIVANQIRGATRRIHHERAGGAGDAAPSAPEDGILAEVAPHLDDALGQISSGRREAIVRTYLQGRPPREVAAELGCSIEALRVRLHEGLALLRGILMRRRKGDLSVAVLVATLDRAGTGVPVSKVPGSLAATLAAGHGGASPLPAAAGVPGPIAGAGLLAATVALGMAPSLARWTPPPPPPAIVLARQAAASPDPPYLYSQGGHRWKYPEIVAVEDRLLVAIRQWEIPRGDRIPDAEIAASQASRAAMEELHLAVAHGDRHRVVVRHDRLPPPLIHRGRWTKGELIHLVIEARALLEVQQDLFAGHLTAALAHCHSAEEALAGK